jgi:3-oxoacyl-[acyl-carrier-protein] synthase II
MSVSNGRRVVITGMGVVTPLGLSLEALWAGLEAGTSAVGPLDAFDSAGLPLRYAAQARCFTGEIADFGPLDGERKKAIRKGLKVMCRESQMAVAAAQRALGDAGDLAAHHAPERIGCVFGSDYMLTLPEDFTGSVAACRGADGGFDYELWGGEGLPRLNPLWLLKYLPNMPASHIAIFNDLRGPSNSLTLREASGHLAVGEATVTIQRGAADVMIAGATGTRVHPMKTVHALQSEQVAFGDGDPTAWSRPFDRDRRGMVLGEGAAVLVLEELGHAERRGARIHGEVIGHAARAATDRGGVGRRRRALSAVLRRAVEMAAIDPAGIGHVHAHGASTAAGDPEEAAAIGELLGADATRIPTVAAKSHFGNLGAGSGLVETVGSIMAVQHGHLFPLLNHETPDESCPVRAARAGDPAGTTFVSVATTPQGQAGGIVVRGWPG